MSSIGPYLAGSAFWMFIAAVAIVAIITERARRRRLWGQILLVAAVLIVASWNLRPILEAPAGAVRMIGEVSPASTALLFTPWGWAASMLAGIWLLLRFRPSRR
jgi:hypothetical protein